MEMMMPPVTANHPINQEMSPHHHPSQSQSQQQLSGRLSSSKITSSDAGMHNINKYSQDAKQPSSSPLSSPPVKQQQHQQQQLQQQKQQQGGVLKKRTSMDPPSALDPADLIDELSMLDAHNDDDDDDDNDDNYYYHEMNINPSSSGGSSGSGGSGDSQGNHGRYNIPPQQQLNSLRSKYFQPKGSSRQPQQQAQASSSTSTSRGIRGGDNVASPQSYTASNRTTATTTRSSTSSIQQQHYQQHQRYSGSATASASNTNNFHNHSEEALLHLTNQGPSRGSGRQSGSSSNSRTRNEVTHSIGTYSIPTFKSSEDDNNAKKVMDPEALAARDRRRAATRSKLKNYRVAQSGSSGGITNDGSTRDSLNVIRSASARRMNANGTSSNNARGYRRKYSDGGLVDEGNDDWMEEALLNGITAANKGRGPQDFGEDKLFALDRSDYSTEDLLGQLLSESSNTLQSSQSQRQKQQKQQQQHYKPTWRESEMSQSERDRSSGQRLMTSEQQQQQRQRSKSAAKSSKYNRGQSSGSGISRSSRGSGRGERALGHNLGESIKMPLKGDGNATTSNDRPRRRPTLEELINPEISIEDLIMTNRRSSAPRQSNNTREARHPSQTSAPQSPPDNYNDDDDAPSNIPKLPTIKTYKVTKSQPNEPAGLFLTKAKNGAVLVHSLSPESLFRKYTPLHPGQEVLSVNEKRVNDPKMAATLITQAKKTLSLRISTVERSRGFMYCQVKRRKDATSGGGGGGVDVGAPADSGETAAIGGATREGRKRPTNTANNTGPSHHGVRFVTTSIDGVRRGTITEGLVRVSHIDPQGLFANSHPMNRLRVGGIVLTVNGTPVTNGRSALEEVMGSRQLVEVLHCDERVWREDWVKDGLEQVLTGQPASKKDLSSSIFGGSGNSNNHNSANSTSMWDMQWKSEREEVTLRKKKEKGGLSYAFKLIFNNDVGTCHPELVDDTTMMPPTDEFDVSLLVQMVNDSQRTMMTVLQNMLKRALVGEGKFTRNTRQHASTSSRQQQRGGESSNAADMADMEQDHRDSLKRRERINSCDVLTELVEDEHGGMNEELCQIADSLLRVDSRDRSKRNTLRASTMRQGHDVSLISTPTLPRRGSTGLSEGIGDLSPADIEQWRWENQPTAENKLRDFSARQHKMEEQYNYRHANRTAADVGGGEGFSSQHQKSVASMSGSMFSTDMLEDFLDYLDEFSNGDDSSVSTPSNSSHDDEGSELNDESPPSPRDEANNKWDDGALRISPTQESSEVDNNDIAESKNDQSSPTEKKGDDEMAYITGVWRDVESKYEISDKVVGSGGFGEVRDCYDKKTGQIYVVKTILKPEQSDTTKINLIRNEILLLHEAHHPNIVELRDLFEDDKFVHIVMERCTGGDLFDRVVNENPRRLRTAAEAMKHEARTANSMRSILHVLKYLHSKGIVHRDIKPEHFLLTTEERETQKIKLIDFGLARKHKAGSAPMTTFTGSPSFVAPEVIARRYDHMCDMFSVGVTAYFLLTGMLPFDGPTDEETFDLISEGRFKFPSSSVFLSDDAKDFITKLLKVDPNKRMSAGRALNHPWLLKAASC